MNLHMEYIDIYIQKEPISSYIHKKRNGMQDIIELWYIRKWQIKKMHTDIPMHFSGKYQWDGETERKCISWNSTYEQKSRFETKALKNCILKLSTDCSSVLINVYTFERVCIEMYSVYCEARKEAVL